MSDASATAFEPWLPDERDETRYVGELRETAARRSIQAIRNRSGKRQIDVGNDVGMIIRAELERLCGGQCGRTTAIAACAARIGEMLQRVMTAVSMSIAIILAVRAATVVMGKRLIGDSFDDVTKPRAMGEASAKQHRRRGESLQRHRKQQHHDDCVNVSTHAGQNTIRSAIRRATEATFVAIAIHSPLFGDACAAADTNKNMPVPPAPVAPNSTTTALGEVVRVDTQRGTIAIRHGELSTLQLRAATTMFPVKDRAMLDRLKPGDRIEFTVEHATGKIATLRVERSSR